MPENSLDIVVKLVDEASRQLADIKKQVTTLGDEVETTGKKTNGFSDMFDKAKGSSVAFAAALGAAATAAGVFGFKAVQAAAESEVQIAKLNATLNTMGASAVKNKDKILQAAGAAAQLGFDDEAAAVSIGNLYQRTGDLNQAMKLNQVAMDLSRAKNIDLSTASGLVGMVLSGNGRALKQFGVELDDTKTPLEALAELQKKVAGQSEAFSKTFTGQAETLKVQWGNFMEEVGGKLLPVLTELLTKLNSFVQDTLPKWIEQTKQAVDWLGQHKEVIFAVAGAITAMLAPAFILAAGAAYTAATAFFTAMAPLALIGAAIGLLVFGIMKLIPLLPAIGQWFVDAFNTAKTVVMDAANSIWGTITNVFNAILGFFNTIWEGIKAVFLFNLNFIVGFITLLFASMGIDIVAVWTGIQNFFMTFFEWLVSFFTASLAWVQGIWNSVWGGIKTYTMAFVNFVKTLWGEFWGWMLTTLTEKTKPLSEGVQKLWDGMKDAASAAWEAAKSVVASSVNWIIDKINVLIRGINAVAQAGSKVTGTSIGSIPEIPKLAKGGTVAQGGSAIVGENGAELLNLPTGARVTPLDKSQPSIVININYPTVMSGQDLVEKVGDPLMQIIKQHMAIV